MSSQLFTVILFTFLLQSCAGYKVVSHSGHKTINNTVIRIPMIKNMTPFVDAGGIFTLEIIQGLAETGKFKIKSGAPNPRDHVLVGRLVSPKDPKQVKKNIEKRFIGGSGLQESIGERQGFYIPLSYETNFKLEFTYLGYRPGEANRSIIKQFTIPVRLTFVNQLKSITESNKEGLANFTNNHASMKFVLQNTARGLVNQIGSYLE